MIRRWFAARRRARDIRDCLDLLNDPTAFRISAPGWGNMTYIADPSGNGLAIATPRTSVAEPRMVSVWPV